MFNIENFSSKLWNEDLQVGLTGAFLCTKIFGHLMSKKRCGNIINISSDLGIIYPDQRLYSDFIKPISFNSKESIVRILILTVPCPFILPTLLLVV